MRVQAVQSGVTYIGATFCTSDPQAESLHKLFQSNATPRCTLQDISLARQLVAGKGNSEPLTTNEAILATGLESTLSPARLRMVAGCLLRIETGLCEVFPKTAK